MMIKIQSDSLLYDANFFKLSHSLNFFDNEIYKLINKEIIPRFANIYDSLTEEIPRIPFEIPLSNDKWFNDLAAWIIKVQFRIFA